MTMAGPDRDRRGFFRSLAQSIGVGSRQPPWTRVDSVDEYGDGVLWGAAARHRDDLFVVGDDGLVLHYDGSYWSRKSNDSELPLHAVAFTGEVDALAVGWLGIISRYESGMWWRLQGGEMDSAGDDPLNDRSNYPLFGLWSDGSGEAWAVGDGGRIAHIRGETVRELVSGCASNLRSIVGLPDGSLIASGADGTVMRGGDDCWERIETGTACMLTGLSAGAGRDVFAVGGEYSVRHQGFLGRIFHLDGEGWREVETEFALPRMRDVAIDGDRLLAVGDQGSVVGFDGTRVVRHDGGTQHDLYAALSLAEAGAWACGAFGTLVRQEPDGSAVSPRSISAPATIECWDLVHHGSSDVTLRGVWAHSEYPVFVVGESGTIIRFDGTEWSKMRSPTDVRLMDVWGSSPENVYAVGEAGTIIRFDGTQWQTVHRGNLDLALVAMTGFGPDQIFAVGDGGTILRFDGTVWSRAETGTGAAFFAVWGLDPDHVLAVGEAGLVLRWNGTCWERFFAGTESALYGVWGDSLDRIFLAGLAGTVIRFDGSRWLRRPSHQRSDLLAIGGNGDLPALAVGSLGTALRLERGEWVSEETGCDETLRDVCVTPEGTAFAVGDRGRILRRGGPSHETKRSHADSASVM
jgi:hypothetical protein